MTDPTRVRDGGGSEELGRLIVTAEEDVLTESAQARVLDSLESSGLLDGASTTRWGAGHVAVVCALVAGSAAVAIAVGLRSPSPSVTATAPNVLPVVSASIVAPVAAPSADPVLPEPAAPRAPALRRPPQGPASGGAEPPSPREGLLLLQAREALEEDPARALELVKAHERQFPHSQLAPERATLRQAALARLAH
jgi:hypothetical protein